MAASITHPSYSSGLHIPVDLFVSKKHPNLPRGVLGFADAFGNIIFRVNSDRVLIDAAGNPLVSIHPSHNGVFFGYKGNDKVEKNMLFRVQRTLNTLSRTEMEVCLVGENKAESTSDLKVRGFPFQRSCTIYRGDSIVAQTSLMYKLWQLFVSRSKFRLTIFPGPIDHAVIVALIVIYFYG